MAKYFSGFFAENTSSAQGGLRHTAGPRAMRMLAHYFFSKVWRENFLLVLQINFFLHFLGLSNHCKLEVVQCAQSAVQKVKIALQLENGGRVIGEYSSEDTLDKMLEKAQSKLEGNIPNGHEPVVIYMRKEIGKKQPKKYDQYLLTCVNFRKVST